MGVIPIEKHQRPYYTIAKKMVLLSLYNDTHSRNRKNALILIFEIHPCLLHKKRIKK